MTCSLKDTILSFDRPVPRYTSYPTAPHFLTVKEEAKLAEKAISNIKSGKNVSLYFHVPFCPKLCWYCGCHTKITQKYTPVEDYIHLLMKEIYIVSEHLSNNNPVSHVHFGGGSPGMMRAVDFNKIMEHVRKRFNLLPDVEISIELDPRNITEGRAATYAKNGVNRVSLGIQDFDSTVLKAVNREQPFHLSYNALKLLRDYGVNNINFDLMYGLPHQTKETMLETIKKVLFLNPSRIAFFGYAHVPLIKKHMRLINESTLPDNAARYDLFETGKEAIENAGFHQIGIDHFARTTDSLYQSYKDKKLKRNFQGYTTDNADIMIGLGASAIGKIDNIFLQNAPDMPTYRNSILTGKIPAKKYLEMTKDDILRSDIIEQVMCYGEVDIEKSCYKHGFDKTYFDKEILQLSNFINKDLLLLQQRKIIVSQEPHFIMRLIANIFDSRKLDDKELNRHAKAI